MFMVRSQVDAANVTPVSARDVLTGKFSLRYDPKATDNRPFVLYSDDERRVLKSCLTIPRKVLKTQRMPEVVSVEVFPFPGIEDRYGLDIFLEETA